MVLVHPKNTGTMYIFSCVICISAGFILRVCLEYKPTLFTIKALVIRALITSCVGYIGYIIYRDYKSKIPISIELYMSILGFFAVFLVSVFNRMGEIGIKSYTKIVLKRLLAYAETEGDHKNEL